MKIFLVAKETEIDNERLLDRLDKYGVEVVETGIGPLNVLHILARCMKTLNDQPHIEVYNIGSCASHSLVSELGTIIEPKNFACSDRQEWGDLIFDKKLGEPSEKILMTTSNFSAPIGLYHYLDMEAYHIKALIPDVKVIKIVTDIIGETSYDNWVENHAKYATKLTDYVIDKIEKEYVQ